jgi:7-cyano-7-deazaguanine reductase
MPPRRSRGGDDQRIAPAHCQYAPPYCTAPDKIVSTFDPRLKRCMICTEAPLACILSRMPRPDLLETFPNPYPDRGYEIAMESAEFTSLCPLGGIETDAAELEALKGGAPDFGTIRITYVPAELCLELKSLKLYLWSFRNDGIFYERAVNRILDDLSHAVKPRWMEVVGDFNVRGGIKSVITAHVGERANA